MHCSQNGVMMLWFLAALGTSEFEKALRGEVCIAPLAAVALGHHLYVPFGVHFDHNLPSSKGWGKAPAQYHKSGQRALMSQNLQ